MNSHKEVADHEPHTHTHTQSVRVLWYHSYLVWLLFGDSIPLFFLNVFLLLVYVGVESQKRNRTR